jgi:heterodisulfide reductase subunit A
MECERVCELNAVFHKDSIDQLDIGAELLIDFTSVSNGSAQSGPLSFTRPGIYTVEADEDRGLEGELARASAVALQVAIDLKLKEGAHPTGPSDASGPAVHPDHTREKIEPTTSEEARVGVVLCNCGGSISSVVDFQQAASEVLQLPGVCGVQQTSQACSEEGAWQIAAEAAKWKLDRLVVAACRCCNLEQICFSCTDRRVMCQRYLSNSPNSRHDNRTEFVNIREQCAWVHRDAPAAATRKAIDIISAGIARAKEPLPVVPDDRPVEGSVLVLGAGLCGLAAARDMTTLGYSVALVSGPELDGAREQQSPECQENRASLMKRIEEQGIHIKPWPQILELNGSPGNYEAVLGYRSQVSHIRTGAVILDLGELGGEVPPAVGAISRGNLLGRIIAHKSCSDSLARSDSAALRGLAINETSGIFFISRDIMEPPEEQVIRGMAAAARASVYLSHGILRPRATAVIIDSKLCRGCGDCATICPYIEIRERDGGVACAYVDQALCLGCGACIAHCPTGAITQPVQSGEQIISTLEALLGRATSAVEAK